VTRRQWWLRRRGTTDPALSCDRIGPSPCRIYGERAWSCDGCARLRRSTPGRRSGGVEATTAALVARARGCGAVTWPLVGGAASWGRDIFPVVAPWWHGGHCPRRVRRGVVVTCALVSGVGGGVCGIRAAVARLRVGVEGRCLLQLGFASPATTFCQGFVCSCDGRRVGRPGLGGATGGGRAVVLHQRDVLFATGASFRLDSRGDVAGAPRRACAAEGHTPGESLMSAAVSDVALHVGGVI
jgi:hypothetical protein